MQAPEIWFPHLNIKIMHLDRVAFNLFGIDVYWYGVLIATAFLVGLLVAYLNAKRFNYNGDVYFDAIIYCIIGAVVGARLYYVAFRWDEYKNNLLEIFALRDGGLAIYGGIILSLIVAYIFTKKKKIDFLLFADIGIPGIAIGQSIGRWGNFFNKEVFGGYTDNILAMRLRTDIASFIPDKLTDTIITLNGADYIQVAPTFLYESLWNLLCCIVLLIYSKRKKFDGEVFLLYFILYGVGRFFIEYIRTDQLLFLGIPISMALSGLFVIASIIIIIIKRKRLLK